MKTLLIPLMAAMLASPAFAHDERNHRWIYGTPEYEQRQLLREIRDSELRQERDARRRADDERLRRAAPRTRCDCPCPESAR